MKLFETKKGPKKANVKTTKRTAPKKTVTKLTPSAKKTAAKKTAAKKTAARRTPKSAPMLAPASVLLSVDPPKGTRMPLMVVQKNADGLVGPYCKVLFKPDPNNPMTKVRTMNVGEGEQVVTTVQINRDELWVRVWSGDERNGNGALCKEPALLDMPLGTRLRWFGGTACSLPRAEILS